jgi:DNA-binding transcriptional ArsR family regulator
MTDFSKTARIFKVLSVETRVQILELLKKRSLCVNALSETLGISPAAVSQHLRILRDVNIVIADKQGYYVHYRVNEETMRNWLKVADETLSLKR